MIAIPAQTGVTVQLAMHEATVTLVDSESPRLDSELLMGHVLGCDRAKLYSRMPECMDPAVLDRFRALIKRRADGEPVAYITGRREFWSLPLTVDAHTLIPRPETECVVEQCLTLIDAHGLQSVADFGTGSGAIALAIALERPGCHVLALELCPAAADIARTNATTLKVSNVEVRTGDWGAPMGKSFDLVVSNPPYVAADDPHLRTGDVRFEPRAALVAGTDGLVCLRQIMDIAPSCLHPGGWLVLEHGYDQADVVANLLDHRGFKHIGGGKDYAGLGRFVWGQKPAP